MNVCACTCVFSTFRRTREPKFKGFMRVHGLKADFARVRVCDRSAGVLQLALCSCCCCCKAFSSVCPRASIDLLPKHGRNDYNEPCYAHTTSHQHARTLSSELASQHTHAAFSNRGLPLGFGWIHPYLPIFSIADSQAHHGFMALCETLFRQTSVAYAYLAGTHKKW